MKLFLPLALFFVSVPAMAYESPNYTLEKTAEFQGNTIEVRHYAPTVLAEVVKTGVSQGEASNQAFRTLFSYIQGANVGGQEVAMTVPVQQAPSGGTKIAMTVPVQQKPATESQSGEESWIMSFHLPQKFTLATAPQPTNPAVTLREQPAQKRLVLQYTGSSSDKTFEKHTQVLQEYVMQNQLNIETPAIRAVYNGPFTPWFLRRNEVMYRLK